MRTGRLEAFSDGVLAIIITIMVLEMKPPEEPTLAALRPVLPVFLAYVLSFVYLGIYWNNHHHMLHVTDHVDGRILWANLHLLFWLSLIPFVTGWLGNSYVEPVVPVSHALPTAMYGLVLLLAAVAWSILEFIIIRVQGPDSKLRRAVGRDVKGRISLVMYAAAIPLAYFLPWLSVAFYVGVALLWIVPDRRIERAEKAAGE